MLFLGSSCIYPSSAPQPIQEDSLLTGPLEPTNDAYAIAKIAGILHVQALRRQYGLPYISAMPTNLYGPGDNFDPTAVHVLPALIRRFHEAAAAGAAVGDLLGHRHAAAGVPARRRPGRRAACTCWRTTTTRARSTSASATTSPSASSPRSSREVVGYAGAIEWDTTKPDGTPRKLLDISRIRGLGWQPKVDLPSGVASTYQWFLRHQDDFRR